MEPIIDMHVHTHHSAWDCSCPMERYFRRIEAGGVPAIGFADHYHPQMEFDPARKDSPNLFNCDRYAEEIGAAAQRGLPVHMGLEVTHTHTNRMFMEHAMEQLKRQPYEYVIGSIHVVADGVAVSRGNYEKDVRDAAHMAQIIGQYYDGLLDILRYPQYTVMGHVDIYRRPLTKTHPFLMENRELILDRIDETAKACAQSPIIIEINTSGYTRAYGDFLPGREFLSRYRSCGGERICFASDAHDVARLAEGFAQAREFALSLGFRYLFYPWEGGTGRVL